MDNIEKLLDEIREDRQFRDTYFTGGFLNNVADIFEKYGFGTTEVYLKGRRERNEGKQANFLLSLLDKFNKYPEIKNRHSIGRMIIKSLISLKRR